MTTTTPTVLRYLADHVDKIARHPDAEAMWDELEEALASVEATVDTRQPAKYAGKCEVCGRDLYAEAGTSKVTCRPCNIEHDVDEQWASMLDEVMDQRFRSSEAARVIASLSDVKVSRQDIDKWASVGLLVKHGTDAKGRPMYRVSEVIDRAQKAEADRKRRAEKRSRRGA